jgi:hypothetical protein
LVVYGFINFFDVWDANPAAAGFVVYQSGVMTRRPCWTSILTRWPGGKPACSSHMPAMRSHGKNLGVRQGLPGFGEGRQRMISWTVAWRSG